MRDVVLHAIYADVDPRSHARDDGPLSDANLDRLYRLDWRGHGQRRNRLPNREDAGHQPDPDVLHKALWYMRTCLNAYAAVAPLTAVGQRSLHPLPVYGPDPFLAAP